MTYGFIDDMTEMLLEYVPTSKQWARANARTTLSTAIGPKTYIISPLGHLQLNTFDIIIGPSGIAVKSVPIKNFTYPILKALSEKVKVDLIIPNRYSIEGMIQWFSEKSCHGAFLRDEWTTIFKDQSKSYLSDMLEFISEMYDGMVQKRFTRKMQLEHAENIYVPMLGATTPFLYKIMSSDFFVQGTGNRARFEIYKGKDYEHDGFKWDFSDKMEVLKTGKIEKYAEILKMYFDSSIEFIALMPEAQDVWVKFRDRLDKLAREKYEKNPFDLVYVYISRSAERVLKYAGLNRLSALVNTPEMLKTTQIVAITEEDIKIAMDEEKQCLRDFQLMLREWKKWGRQEEPALSKRGVVWQIVSVLASAPNRMLNTQKWMDIQDVVSDSRFWDYKKKAETWGWVRELKQSEKNKVCKIPGELERLQLDQPHVTIWTITKKWLEES